VSVTGGGVSSSFFSSPDSRRSSSVVRVGSSLRLRSKPSSISPTPGGGQILLEATQRVELITKPEAFRSTRVVSERT